MRTLAIAGLAAAALALSGCTARDIDVQATGAHSVPGASNLYRFCDGPVLIYFTKITGEDQYDWYWPGGCLWDARSSRWVFGNTAPTGQVPNGDSLDEPGN